MYRAAKIDTVTCEADACTVKLRLTYDYQQMKGIDHAARRTWMITQGPGMVLWHEG